MRTLTNITDTIKSDFVAHDTLAAVYELDRSKTFDEQFSKVSLEACLIHVVAMSIWLLEQIVGTTKTEIEAQIDKNYMCSIPWYHAKALEYQQGHRLVYNEKHHTYGYEVDDPKARIIKYVAVREVITAEATTLQIMVSKADRQPIYTEEMPNLYNYMLKIGAAGTKYQLISRASDRLKISVQVNYNPLVLDVWGGKILDGTQPVDIAVAKYIDEIVYGGVFNKTKLTDAIQSADGVVDVILNQVQHATASGTFTTLAGNSVESTSGSFTFELTVNYLAQNGY